MKRIFALLFCLLFTGCASMGGDSMTLSPAQLTQKEEQMVQLLTPNQGILLDFAADEQLQSLSVSIKELDGTQWVSVGGGSYGLEDSSGRIALQFDLLDEGLRTAIQTKNYFVSSNNFKPEKSDREGLAWGSTILSDSVPLEYETEIPVAIQAFTTGSFYSTDVSAYYEPEQLAERGYAKVLALTITFSTQQLT